MRARGFLGAAGGARALPPVDFELPSPLMERVLQGGGDLRDFFDAH